MTSSFAASETIEFLHRLDCERGDALVVRATREGLRRASFLDGRESFWSSETLLPFATMEGGACPADRFIFHVGFCGSTLLARLIDEPGSTLVLKEPQVLTDISSQRRAIANGDGVAPLDSLSSKALAHLGQAGGAETVVIKPTNWVNPIVTHLCAPERKVRAVFVSMDRRAFLGAAFRGGRDRLEFCTRLAAEIAPAAPHGERLLAAAIAAEAEPFDRVARIVALLHTMQERLFDLAIEANGWPATVRIDFADLTRAPAEVLENARSLLELPPADDPVEQIARVMERNTKDTARTFSAAVRRDEDQEIERHHGARFDRALAWLEAALTA